MALSSDNTPDIGTMPAVLTSITVSPVSPSVVSGQTERFTAQGLDQDGNVVTGVVFIWGIANAQKDAGSIDSDTGVFTAGTTPGTYKDAIEAKSDNVTGTASVTVTPAALAIATVSLVYGQEGVDYSYTLVAAGGTSPYTWSIIAGSLPDGLGLGGDTISGTPTTVGTSSFTANVTDSTSPTPQTVTRDLSITISPAVLTTSDNATEITSDNTTETTSFIVRLVAGLSVATQQQVIARDGGVETSSVLVLNMHFIKVPDASADEVIQRYESDPQVRSIERDKVRKVGETSSDPSYPDQWALPKISWDSVFGSVIPTGSSVIAILDTGIDASHPDLSGLVLSGYSTFEGSDAQTDPNGHGTKMAGIAAALTNNGIGVAGVAYAGVSLLPIQVLSPDGTGQDSDIIRGIVWAVDHGANVILMAFSNPDYSPTLQEAIDYAWDHGVILVAAAGNDGLSTVTYPAGDRGVIGVSATDSNDALVSSSNYGQIVFLAAPGVNLLTTCLDGAYTAVSGTSAAAAVVAGAAAFMHAVDPSLSNGVIVGRLARAADSVGTQEQTGNGRINMARALSDTGTAPVEPAGASPLGDGGPYVGPYVAAAIITSTATGGAWTTTGTWVGGVAPISTDSVVIATTGANSVTTGGSLTCAGITINSGATLSMANGNVLTVNGGVSGAGTWTGTGATATISLTGGWSFTGTITGTANGVTLAGTGTQSIAGFTTTGTVSMTKTGGTATFTGNVNAGALTINGTGGTLNLGTGLTHTITGTWTRTNGTLNGGSSTLNLGGSVSGTGGTFTASTGTVNYNAAGAQTVAVVTYNNLTTSGSGTKTLGGTVTVNGNLNVGSGTGFTVGAYSLTVTGATGITGTLTISSTTGTKTFGDITINNGGTMTFTAAEDVTMNGNLQNNGTFSGTTGTWTFQKTGGGGTISGGSSITVATVTFATAYTNSGTFTVSGTLTVTGVTLTNNGTITATGALSGTGGLTNTGTLNLGGTSGITTLTATASGNTVNYTGAAQTVKATTYHHLTTSGSGTKTLGGTVTVNGNLNVGSGTGFTVGAYSLTVTGATSITGTLTISSTTGTKTFGDITINNGGTMTFTAAEAVTMNGNLQNNGTFSGTTGTWTFQKTGGGGTISGGSGITVATATFVTAYTNSGTFTVSGTLTVTGVTLTNNGTITATGALSGSGGLTNTGTLNLGGTSAITTLTATASGNTVNFNGASGQTIPSTTFYNLTLNNSNAFTINNNVIINGTLNFTSGNIVTGANTVIIGSGGSISRSTGHVVGNLQKYVATGTTSLTFEVGTASNYNPVTVAFGNVTVAGNLTVKVTSSQHPNFGTSTINSSKYVNEYWSLTNSGVVFNNFSATFTFVSGDILGGADPSNFIVGEYSGGWTYPTVGTKTATSTQATGISSFGDFCIGEPGNPPTVNSVTLVDTSMTPQTQYTVTVNVSNAGGKNALNTLVLKLWYDSSGSDHSESTFDSRTADTQNCAIITWIQSTDSFTIQPSSSTTWVLGTCSSPGSLPGDFIFRFTVGKVATETSGSARWQVVAKVSNNVSQTGFNYDSTPPTMNWYGEITVNTVNITWINTAALGSGFTDDTTNRVTNISLTFICNGNYNVQAKAISLWSGNGKTVVLAATDSPGNGEIALKADDDATLSGAVLIISSGYTTFGTGTQTGEGGNTVSNNSLWLKLGSSGIPDVQYSGTIYYSITP